MRPILLATLLSLSSHGAVAQSSTKGVPSPSAIHPIALRDSARIRLFNSIAVLGEQSVGKGRAHVRVIESWGGSAELACDCLLSRLYISVNLDGDELRAYQLPELLDPTLISIVAEKQDPVVYLEYGTKSERRRIRVEILPKSIRVTDAAHR
jgi:hypothetical protein